eukprot:PhM_4_TR6183/c0_g1_i1/m.100222
MFDNSHASHYGPPPSSSTPQSSGTTSTSSSSGTSPAPTPASAVTPSPSLPPRHHQDPKALTKYGSVSLGAPMFDAGLTPLRHRAHKLLECIRSYPPYYCGDVQPVFFQTLEVFHQIWAYIHENRARLEAAGQLRRIDIGEIGSKIAQLQYVYYLRHGDVNFLDDAYKFYEYVREHDYMREESLERRARIYARHILVAVLSNNRGVVRLLSSEIARDVQGTTGADGLFRRFMHDVHTFVVADRIALDAVVDGHAGGGGSRDVLRSLRGYSYRVSADDVPGLANSSPSTSSLSVGGGAPNMPRLHHAVLLAFQSDVRLSELPLECMRMLQALEWETSTSTGPDRVNPRKTILYEPAMKTVLAALLAAQHDGPEGAPLLLYVSHSDASLLDWSAIYHVVFAPTIIFVDAASGSPLPRPPRDDILLVQSVPRVGVRGDMTLFLAAPALGAWRIISHTTCVASAGCVAPPPSTMSNDGPSSNKFTPSATPTATATQRQSSSMYLVEGDASASGITAPRIRPDVVPPMAQAVRTAITSRLSGSNSVTSSKWGSRLAPFMHDPFLRLLIGRTLVYAAVASDACLQQQQQQQQDGDDGVDEYSDVENFVSIKSQAWQCPEMLHAVTMLFTKVEAAIMT